MDLKGNFLSPVDYAVILITLLISASIGFYFRLTGGKQSTTEEYLRADRNMGILPVAFSLMATYLSTVTLMGIPAEMYFYGTHMAFTNIGFILGILTSSFLFLPVYFNTQVTTTYEYLEKRFGAFTRTMCSLGFSIQMVLYMGVVLYTPALALSAMTNISTWVSVSTISLICTLYCTLGGMKAVLWTDFFQALLMLICLFSVVAKGNVDQDGIMNIFDIAKQGGRLIVPSFTVDVTLRYTMWNILLQGFAMTLFNYGTSQLHVQRLLTVNNTTRSQLALFSSIPLTVGFHLLCCMCGLVLYAEFQNCHPNENSISSGDQLLPYYIMMYMNKFPGLAGLCIGGLFAASFSTISSMIQTLTVVTMEDFILPFCQTCDISQTQITLCAKAMTILYGCLGILLSFLVTQLENVIRASITLCSVLSGPLLGLFLLGVLTTKANEKGTILGLIISFCLASWMTFGPFSSTIDELTFSTDGCYFHNNETSENNVTNTNDTFIVYQTSLTSTTIIETTYTEYSFQLSYMWIMPIAVVASMVFGYLFSVILEHTTGKQEDIPEEFLSPMVWCLHRRISRKTLSAKSHTKEEESLETHC